MNNNLFPDIPRESVRVHSLPPIVHIMSFLRRRLCENTLISPEGVDYSPGRSPGFFGLRNRRNILAPAHTFERSRSKVWAGAFYEDVCLCRVPRTASWAIFSVLHFVPDFLATAGHSDPFHTVSFAGMTEESRGGYKFTMYDVHFTMGTLRWLIWVIEVVSSL